MNPALDDAAMVVGLPDQSDAHGVPARSRSFLRYQGFVDDSQRV